MTQYFSLNRITLVVFASLAVSPLCQAEDVSTSIPQNIPAEFRELWQQQTEIVEVKLYGQSLGNYQVSVTPDTVRFDQPEKLLEKLAISREQRNKALPLLSAPQARNGNLSCQGEQQAGSHCNYINTKTLAIIYDDSDSVLHLFLGWDLLPENSESDRFIRPTQDVHLGLLHSQSVNFSDSDGYRALSLAGIGALGISQNSYAILDWRTDYNRIDGDSDRQDLNAQVNSFYYRFDLANRYYLQAGRMDNTDLSRPEGGNFSFSLMPVPKIEGGRAGTTQSYLRQSEHVVATPVTLMLTQFSRIEARRGSQLLGTTYMAAGVQQLDTRTFPVGSYTLELRVFVQDRLVRSEAVPFTKGNATFGSMQWDAFIQGGKLTSQNQLSNDSKKNPNSALQAGIRVPLGMSATVQQGVSALDSSKYYESKLDWSTGLFSGVLSTSFSWLRGAEDTRGNSETLSYNDGFSLSLYHYQQNAGEYTRNDDLNWGGCNESYNASLSLPVLGWQTTLGYTDNRNQTRYRSGYYDPQRTAKEPYSPPWKDTFGRSKTWQLNTSGSYQFKNVSIIPNLGLWQSHTSTSGTDRGIFLTFNLAQMTQRESGKGRNISAGYTLRNSRRSGTNQNVYVDGLWSHDGDGYRREIETRVNAGTDSYEGMVRGRNNNRFGDVNGTLSASHQRHDGDNRKSAALTWDSSTAITRKGVFWGGNATGIDRLAGSTVSVEAEDETSPLIALSGAGNTQQTLSGGQKMLVPFTGLTQSQLSIGEVAGGRVNVQIDRAGDRNLFLLPGHIYSQTVSAETSWTYIGRALDEHRQPLAGAVLLNTNAMRLDEQGGFSFDYSRREKVLYLLKDKTVYSCPAVAKPRRDALIFLGEIICQTVAVKTLPHQLVTQHRVSALLANR